MLVSHKIALNPNNRQRTYFARAAGTARFAYNWALGEWKRQFEAWKKDNSLSKPSAFQLDAQLTAIKRRAFPWMIDVTVRAVQESILSLDTAFRAFFEGRSNYPKFKKKFYHESFCAGIGENEILTHGKIIILPKVGWVKLHEPLRFRGKIKRATISREADRWYVSILVETEDPKPINHPEEIVGVDLGITTFATFSNGTKIEGPKPRRRLQNRVRRLQRSLSRKKKGSRNREKAQRKLARLHARISHIRNDAIHKLTYCLTRTFKTIVIEDLNVSGMLRNHHLAFHIADGGFSEFKRQLIYKSKISGSKLIVVDRFYPSTKTCSNCGHVKSSMRLSQRIFNCDSCGTNLDRDLNAATNLKNYAASYAVSACGEERSGRVSNCPVKRTFVKQEFSSRSKACVSVK